MKNSGPAWAGVFCFKSIAFGPMSLTSGNEIKNYPVILSLSKKLTGTPMEFGGAMNSYLQVRYAFVSSTSSGRRHHVSVPKTHFAASIIFTNYQTHTNQKRYALRP